MMRELHAIGNDMNQIAAKLHSRGAMDAERYDKEAYKLAAVLAKISAASSPERM